MYSYVYYFINYLANFIHTVNNQIDVASLTCELASNPVEEFNAVFRRNTVWLGRIINYLQPQNGVDVYRIVHRIQSLIQKDLSVLECPTCVVNAVQLTNKLREHVYSLIASSPNPIYQRFLSCVFSLEAYILTHLSSNQSHNKIVLQAIMSRLTLQNVISYLVKTSFNQNATLATACCSYIEQNKDLGIKKLQMHLLENPGNTIYLLNAGCLAKNDFIIKIILEAIYIKRSFEIFQADKKLLSALDYLIDKEDFSNQTLVVGDLQNPRKILISKEILTQRNSYFNRLFQANFVEKSQRTIILKNTDPIGEHQGIDYEGFLYLIRYVYAGKTDIPLETCPVVSYLADMYLEFDLKKICLAKMRSS